MRKGRIFLAGLLVGVAFASAATVAAVSSSRPTAWDAAFDSELQRAFAAPGPHGEASYGLVMAYLLTSFVDRQRPGGSRADQPGARSRHGLDVDAMEGFTRLAPLVAAWLAGGRDGVVTDLRGRRIELLAWLRQGVVAGTTPGTPASWGPIADRAQAVVEAADVARSVWLVRERLLPTLSDAERQNLIAWLRQAVGVEVPDNNWHLYPVLIHEVLVALGSPGEDGIAAAHFRRFLQFQIGQGWYGDGPGPASVDWYNAWAIHYELWWLRRVSPGYGGAPVADDLAAFARDLAYLVGPEGIPIMGRSVCYRLAAPAPLVAAALDPDRPGVAPGLAHRALDAVWSYFVAHGAIAGGVVTQGYCGADLRVLDNYSGASSCLWSLRALTLALLAGPGSAFWSEPELPLPVETGDYVRPLPALGWSIVGTSASGEVRIVQSRASRGDGAALEPYGWWRRMVSTLLWFRPYRPDNHAAKYALASYSSAAPFCGCLAPAGEAR